MSEASASPKGIALTSSLLELPQNVLLVNCVLFVMYMSFFVYLIIPRGFRKHFCNAYPKRFPKTYFQKHEVPTLVTTHRKSYESIDDAKTNMSHNNETYQFRSPSARSPEDPGCTAGFRRPPAPIVLNPEKAWIMTGEALMLTNNGQKTTPTGSSLYSSPSRGVFATDRRDRMRSRTPLPPKIDEDKTMTSPNSVLDQSMSSSKKLLVLMSSRILDKQQMADQKEAFELLRTRGVSYDKVDGMNALQRNRREELYAISGTRAQYPQFFFVHEDGATSYLGDWKELQKIHHAEGLPRRFRAANPNVSTWNEVFSSNVCDTSQYFSV